MNLSCCSNSWRGLLGNVRLKEEIMDLYVALTTWVFLILLLGLRPDAYLVAECWPDSPDSRVAKSNKKVVTTLALLTFLLFWILTAFRSSQIGNDTKTYIYYFHIYSEGIDRLRTFEIGYQYLNYFISRITMDPHHFLIIIATIMYGGVVWYIYKYSKNIAISVCLFYCYFFSLFTSIFRQGIAMVIVLYGYQLLKEGKRIKALLLFLLATTFHTTAVVSFFLFLNADVMKKKWFVFSLTAICGALSGTGILNTIVSAILPRYAHYFDSRYAATGWLAVSYSLVIYSVWYFLISQSVDNSDAQDRLVATNFTLLLIFAAFGFSVNLFTRAGEYYLLIAVTEIPNMLFRRKVSHYRVWMFCLCTILLIMFIVTLIFRPGWNHLYPYEFWNH